MTWQHCKAVSRERLLEAFDRFLHWSLDWYINRTLPGWGHLQLWQHYVCDAYEAAFDMRGVPPIEPPGCGCAGGPS